MVAEITSPGQRPHDLIKITAADGRKVSASCQSLATRTAFFAQPSFEDSPDRPRGGCRDADAELEQLSKVLAPGARKALPALIEFLGAEELQTSGTNQPRLGDDVWGPFFERWGVLHTFAAAHLIGASEPLDAARRWVSVKGDRLERAVSVIDIHEDAGSLRTALDFGLDQACGRSLIHSAATVDAAGVVRILLEKRGEDVLLDADTLVDLPDAHGHTPLHACAVHDSVEAAAALIESSANLEALCSHEGEENICEDGMELEGDPAVVNKVIRKWTPLHLAATYDSAGVAEVLLGARANVSACVKSVKGAHTPLHEAAEASATSVARLLAPAAAACAVDLEKMMVAGGENLENAGSLKRGDVMPMGGGQDPDTVVWSRFLDPINAKCGHNGSTPLHIAAENDAAGVVMALLDAKADACLGDDHGDTPLHCAVLYGSPNALSALLGKAKDLASMQQNAHGELPLHHLAEFGICGDIFELGESAVKRHFAKSNRTRELLLEAHQERGQLAAALSHKAAGSNDSTALHAVARHDHPGALHALQLLADARANLESTDADGRSALAVAIRHNGDRGGIAMKLRSLGAAECDASVIKDPNGREGDSVHCATGSRHDEALAQALGGHIRQIQLPGVSERLGLNILEIAMPGDVSPAESSDIPNNESNSCDAAAASKCEVVTTNAVDNSGDSQNKLSAEITMVECDETVESKEERGFDQPDACDVDSAAELGSSQLGKTVELPVEA